MGLERVHQIVFEVGQLRLQGSEVIANGFRDKKMVRTQFALQRR